MRDTEGWIYTIHFDKPLGTAGRNAAWHYTGWAVELLGRLLEHRAGYGSKIMAEVQRRGITWHVGHLQRGTFDDERRLKRHSASRRCWTCRATGQGAR